MPTRIARMSATELLARYRRKTLSPVEATKAQFAPVRLINPNEILGSWDDITAKHFDNGGILDQLLATGR